MPEFPEIAEKYASLAYFFSIPTYLAFVEIIESKRVKENGRAAGKSTPEITRIKNPGVLFQS
jgi:hypothetical protein